MPVRVAVPDLVSPSYFPAIAAVELGFFEAEGLAATVELIFPVTKTIDELRDGRVDYLAGSAHAPLYGDGSWAKYRLVCALSQHMYWFLVVRSDLDTTRGDLDVLRGLRIAAARGPDDGLRRLLREAGVDPEHDVEIGPIQAATDGDVSFGVAAAQALETGAVDGFWANGMGAEVATLSGVGTVLLDARRGDGPPGTRDYTFPALATTQAQVEERPEQTAAAVRAIVAAQRALASDPVLAVDASARHFPARERALIAELVRRDASFYNPAIPVAKVEALNRFARDTGILDRDDIAYEEVVATQFAPLWAG